MTDMIHYAVVSNFSIFLHGRFLIHSLFSFYVIIIRALLVEMIQDYHSFQINSMV